MKHLTSLLSGRIAFKFTFQLRVQSLWASASKTSVYTVLGLAEVHLNLFVIDIFEIASQNVPYAAFPTRNSREI